MPRLRLHYALILFSLFLTISSCQKENPIVIPVDPEPIPEKGIPIYVPAGRWALYYGHGTGSGYKNGNKFAFTPSSWEIPEKPGTYSVFINTFAAPDSVFQREEMGGIIPDKPGIDNDFQAYYGLVIDGGDVPSQDWYKLDLSKPHWINIDVIDKAKNMIKGSMEAHFYLIDTVNKFDVKNPNHVHFTNLQFETKFKM